MDDMEPFYFLFAFIDRLLYASRIPVARQTRNKTSRCPQSAYSQCIKIIIWLLCGNCKRPGPGITGPGRSNTCPRLGGRGGSLEEITSII